MGIMQVSPAAKIDLLYEIFDRSISFPTRPSQFFYNFSYCVSYFQHFLSLSFAQTRDLVVVSGGQVGTRIFYADPKTKAIKGEIEWEADKPPMTRLVSDVQIRR